MKAILAAAALLFLAAPVHVAAQTQGFVQVPQLGGQGSNPAYQRLLQGRQRRLQMLQNMNNGTHWQTPAPNYYR